MMKGFGHMAIWVTDMERALHFYVDILGCQKAFSMENNGKPGTEYLALANGAFIELFYNGVPMNRKARAKGASTPDFLTLPLRWMTFLRRWRVLKRAAACCR